MYCITVYELFSEIKFMWKKINGYITFKKPTLMYNYIF